MRPGEYDNLYLNHRADTQPYRNRWHEGLSLLIMGGMTLAAGAWLVFHGIPAVKLINYGLGGILLGVGAVGLMKGAVDVTTASADLAAAKIAFNRTVAAREKKDSTKRAAGYSSTSYSTNSSGRSLFAPHLALA